MQSLDIILVLFLLVGAVAASAVIFYVLRIVREWLKRNRPIGGTVRRAIVPDSSLDAHIVTQWTDGRLRLDFLLALIKKLEAALEQDVETLRRLGHADPQYGDQARQMVEPNLRRFTFDQHLRDECRMLIPLLSALAKIQAAIKLVDRG
jgi:hypothetical protein